MVLKGLMCGKNDMSKMKDSRIDEKETLYVCLPCSDISE